MAHWVRHPTLDLDLEVMRSISASGSALNVEPV